MVVSASMGKDSSLSDHKYYAAETAVLEASQTIYALMQCTPDISSGDCKTCLQQSVDDYQKCCHGKRGGYVYRPNCIFRWDLYLFNGPFDHITSTLPQHQPSLIPFVSNGTSTSHEDSKTVSKGIILAFVVLAIVIVLVLLALGFSFCMMRKSHQLFDCQF
uniref:Cysteine-rich receptor-like protein kinase 14 n=1 Tax=Noccaea caerulescens TaxID=107243 RepID=A0A1J3FLM5_NOCCA